MSAGPGAEAAGVEARDAPAAERRGAVVVRALLPLWVIPFGALSWAWLAAGFGGQDLSVLAWWVAICEAITPWHPDGIRWLPMALYGLLLAGPLALCALMAAPQSPPHLRGHARRALVDWLTLVWLLVTTPYAMGLVASLPADGISLVRDGQVVGGNAAGNLARLGAAAVFGGLLLALPAALDTRKALDAARSGAPPLAITHKRWIYLGLAALVGAGMIASAAWRPL